MKMKWWKAGACVPFLAMIVISPPILAQDTDSGAALPVGLKLAALPAARIIAPDTAKGKGIDASIRGSSYEKPLGNSPVLPHEEGMPYDWSGDEEPFYENQFPDAPDAGFSPGGEDGFMEGEPLEEVITLPETSPGEVSGPDDLLVE